jgi:hypothetical protein
MNNWKKLKEGVINGDWFAHYRQARTDSSFKKTTYGCEVFDGAVEYQATEARFEVKSRYDSGSVKEFTDYNNGFTPDIELLTGRMINFETNPNPNPQAISCRGKGYKCEDHRYGCWLNFQIPGENGYVIQMNFIYCSDTEGKVEIKDITNKQHMIKNNNSIKWELYETNIKNEDLFPQSMGLIRNKIHFRLSSKGAGISLTEMETNLKTYNSEVGLIKNTHFIESGKTLNNKRVYLPLMGNRNLPMESYRELTKLSDNMEIKDCNGETFKFEVYYGFKIHETHDIQGYDDFERMTKGQIILKYPKSQWPQPNLFILGPRDKTIAIKTGHQFWDSYGNGKWDWKKHYGLIVFLKPLTDISTYFSNCKTDGFEDEDFEKNVDMGIVNIIKNSKEMVSPHKEKAGKPEDSFVDQFVGKVSHQTNGRELRHSLASIGIHTTDDMMIGKHWRVRKTPGIYELDLQFSPNKINQVLLEAQVKTSDQEHLDGATVRIMRHQEDFDNFLWVAKKHTMIDELEDNLKLIKWSDERKLSKVYFITTEQLLKGFEMRDIEVLDIDEIIQKS